MSYLRRTAVIAALLASVVTSAQENGGHPRAPQFGVFVEPLPPEQGVLHRWAAALRSRLQDESSVLWPVTVESEAAIIIRLQEFDSTENDAGARIHYIKGVLEIDGCLAPISEVYEGSQIQEVIQAYWRHLPSRIAHHRRLMAERCVPAQ